MDTGLWADVACVALDRGVRFLLMGDFRQLPAVLDSFAGARVERPLKKSDLLRDIAGGYCHELTENRRSDERIFQFINWLQVGEAEEVPLAEAVRVARRPAGQHPDVCLVLSHAHRVQINERENTRLAPADAVVIERQVPGAFTTNACKARICSRCGTSRCARSRWRRPASGRGTSAQSLHPRLQRLGVLGQLADDAVRLPRPQLAQTAHGNLPRVQKWPARSSPSHSHQFPNSGTADSRRSDLKRGRRRSASSHWKTLHAFL